MKDTVQPSIKYIPSYFCCMFFQHTPARNEQSFHSTFFSVANSPPDISVDIGDLTVLLSLSPSTRVAVCPTNKITLVLHGEIYSTQSHDQAIYLIEQYIERGEDFVREINGSFVILVLDQGNNRALVVTDRVNSRKVFFSTYGRSYWLSTSLYRHPLSGVALDLIGVAHYLAHGAIHNNRTLFEGVQILERACVYTLTPDGPRATRYWTYEFTNAYAGVDRKELCAELSDLIVESVRVRLLDDPTVFLSLSSGYDSKCILGVLHSTLKVPDLNCFSYYHNTLTSEKDAYISRQIANWLGIKHRVIESYRNDLPRVLTLNAQLGQGYANFCDEINVWIEMSRAFSAAPSALFVGDECFGWLDVKLNSMGDVLTSENIYSFDRLSWLSHMLPRETYKHFYEGLHEDLAQMLKRCPQSDDYHDCKDYLYLDQRVNNVILPWREFFAGRFITVRSPFLDNRVLDFMMKLPSQLRRGKTFYKRTAAAMFPELFRFRRGIQGYVPDWRKEFGLHRDELVSLFTSEESKLDAVIPVELIVRLLGENLDEYTHSSSFSAFVQHLPHRLLRKVSIMAPALEKAMRLYQKSQLNPIDRATLLKRLLVMRLFLRLEPGWGDRVL